MMTFKQCWFCHQCIPGWLEAMGTAGTRWTEDLLSPSNTDFYFAAAAKGKLGEVAKTAAFSYAFFWIPAPSTNFFFHSGLQKSKFCTPWFSCSCATGFGPSSLHPFIPVRGPSHFTPDGNWAPTAALNWRDKEKTKSSVSSISVSRGMTGWCALWILRLAGSRNVC